MSFPRENFRKDYVPFVDPTDARNTATQRRPVLERLKAPESTAAHSGKMTRRPLQVGVVRAMNEVTSILSAIEAGDPHAAADLLPPVYDELRKLAAVRLAAEKPVQTLQPKALVHEAYLVANRTI